MKHFSFSISFPFFLLLTSLSCFVQVTTAPELFPSLIQLNVFSSLLSLLLHENSDVANDVIDLLKEITDPSNLSDQDESLEGEGEEKSSIGDLILEELKKKEIGSLLIRNLERLDELKSAVDAKGFLSSIILSFFLTIYS
jgi:beta-catenin-like protein 1